MKFIRMSSGTVFPDLRDEFGGGADQGFPIPYRCDLTVKDFEPVARQHPNGDPAVAWRITVPAAPPFRSEPMVYEIVPHGPQPSGVDGMGTYLPYDGAGRMMDLDELEDVEYGCTWLPSVCEALGEQRPEMAWCTCYVDGDQMKSIDIDSLVHNDGLHLFGTWCRMIFALRADECISSSTRAMWFGDSVDTMLKREEIGVSSFVDTGIFVDSRTTENTLQTWLDSYLESTLLAGMFRVKALRRRATQGGEDTVELVKGKREFEHGAIECARHGDDRLTVNEHAFPTGAAIREYWDQPRYDYMDLEVKAEDHGVISEMTHTWSALSESVCQTYEFGPDDVPPEYLWVGVPHGNLGDGIIVPVGWCDLDVYVDDDGASIMLQVCSHRLARQERKLQYAYNERYGRLLDDDVPFDPEEWAFTQQMVESDVAIQVLEGLKILQDPEFADPDDEE